MAFRISSQNRMIDVLTTQGNHAHLTMQVLRGGEHRIHEDLFRHVIRAGMRRQHAARRKQAHRGERNLLVAAAGAGHVGVRFGERGRIEHHHVVFFTRLDLRAQKIKAVRTDGGDIRAVERGVLFDQLHGGFADIHCRHFFRSGRPPR